MNIKMWIKAVQTIPRLNKEEWDRLDFVARWLVATRFAVVLMSFFAAMIAGLIAWRDGYFVWWKWILVAVGLTFAHATNNLLNDLTDYRKGVDKDNYFRTQYGPQPLEQGLWKVKDTLRYAAITGIIAVAAGIPLVISGGTPVLILMLVGVFFVLFYTWPLKYIGLGEISVLVIWGPLMVAGGCLVMSGKWDWTVAIAGLPFGLGVASVLFGKHLDKLKEDKAKKIYTTPVILGEKLSRYLTVVLVFLQYLVTLYLIAIQFFTPVALIVFLAVTSLPIVLQFLRKPRPEARPTEYPAEYWPLWFSGVTFLHSRRFGMLYMLAILLDIIVKAIFKL